MRALVLAILVLLVPSAAAAQDSGRKVALVIANGSYAQAGALSNPVNDANLIAAAAKGAGFSVTLVRDQSLSGFQRALRDFRSQADGARVAMVYYAGHGIEGAGKNWLIPVDAGLKSDLDLPYEAIDLDRVMESISGAQVRMVVLDACRNNPFGRSWRSSTRAVTRGLTGLEVDDVLVIYAAAPGQTASDGDGANSPFATSLARRLVEPDLPIQLLGGAVRDDVLAATGGTQRPFVSASITGTPIYLVGRSAPASAVAPAAAIATAQPGIDDATLDALGWQGALGAQSAAGFEEYKTQFPKGRFVKLAEQNIVKLRGVQAQAAAQPPAAQPSPARPAAVQAHRVAASLAETESAIDRVGSAARDRAPALIFPTSSTRRITAGEIAALETVQLTLARNEIYARHGFIFFKPVYRDYFSRFAWYRPESREVKLNAIEQGNVTLLQQAERTRGTR